MNRQDPVDQWNKGKKKQNRKMREKKEVHRFIHCLWIK
jgi:hypothetical protein